MNEEIRECETGRVTPLEISDEMVEQAIASEALQPCQPVEIVMSEEEKAQREKEEKEFEERIRNYQLYPCQFTLKEGVEDNYKKEVEDIYKPSEETSISPDYVKAIFIFASEWAKNMEQYVGEGDFSGLTDSEIEKCSHDADEVAGGITGFMYGAAVAIIANYWKYGEALRKWHNKKYGVDEDAKGVVNPAIITINTSEEDVVQVM